MTCWVGDPNLRLIANVVGYDGVDVPWCRANGIEVTHSRGLNADDVADRAVGLLIARLARHCQRATGWSATAADHRMAPRASFRGRGQHLGHIGEAVRRRLEAFARDGRRGGPAQAKRALADRPHAGLRSIWPADALMVCCRASPEPEADLRRGHRGSGPRGAVTNISRGQVVDEDALIVALKARLGMAGLDVFAQEARPSDRWPMSPTPCSPRIRRARGDSIR